MSSMIQPISGFVSGTAVPAVPHGNAVAGASAAGVNAPSGVDAASGVDAPSGASAASGVNTASGVNVASEVRRSEAEDPIRFRTPAADAYVPEERQAPSGLYWLGKDEDGRPKVFFEDPNQAADAPEKPDDSQEKAPEKKAERCTCSTDRIDREIERLKERRTELEQQIRTQTDDAKAQALEQKSAQVESELRQKDNDAYRRQHAVFF